MKNKAYLCIIFALLFSTASFAFESVRKETNDYRIKTIIYHDNKIVTLHGSHLIATGIQFADSENIISAKVGDALAWLIESSQNMLYVKPILPSSDTNLLVVTNLHTYQFHLITSPSATAKNALYLLKFDYPNTNQSSLSSELQSLQDDIPNMTQVTSHWNHSYSFAGSKLIAPIQARDNGKFTVFKFKKNSDIPAVFTVDNQRNEQLVNFYVQGNDVFIQGIHHQYTLRRGEEVTTIYNDKESN